MHNDLMSDALALRFEEAGILASLFAMADDDLDALDFGVIGFDAATQVVAYNAFESDAAGLRKQSVMGRALFQVVAPCMNNFMVAQRFEDASTTGTSLDATIDYVLTLRMRPVKVSLRLIADPSVPVRYVLVLRNA